MNWLIRTPYCNSKYIRTKCPYYSINVLLNRNIKSDDNKMKLIDFDHSLCNCSEYLSSVNDTSLKIT